MNTIFVCLSLGRMHREQGQYPNAAHELREARTLTAAALGDASPNVV